MYQDPEVGTSQMWKIETIEMWNDIPLTDLTSPNFLLYMIKNHWGKEEPR